MEFVAPLYDVSKRVNSLIVRYHLNLICNITRGANGKAQTSQDRTVRMGASGDD